jgi:hypothetical protein
MLAITHENQVIANLSPWVFLPVPERSIGYCSEALGQSVLPFAQAVGQDLVACFLVTRSNYPAVIVINPWADNSAGVVRAELQDYDAWLIYAEQISREVAEREQEDDDE